MSVVGGYFVVIGLLIFFWTGINSISDETIMHQIYHQICYLTSFVVAGIGYILIALNSKENKKCTLTSVNKENDKNDSTGL